MQRMNTRLKGINFLIKWFFANVVIEKYKSECFSKNNMIRVSLQLYPKPEDHFSVLARIKCRREVIEIPEIQSEII